MLWKTVPVLPAVNSSNGATGHRTPAAMETENSSPPLHKQLLVWHTIFTAALSSHNSACLYLLRYVWDMHLFCSQAHATDAPNLLHIKVSLLQTIQKQTHKTRVLAHNHHSFCVSFQDTISQLQIHKLRYKTWHKRQSEGTRFWQ